jgi:ATP-binding cassette subfamily C protein PrsD
MAMVLYEGRAIAFGPREEIFARVRAGTGQAAAARQPAAAGQSAAAKQTAAPSPNSARLAALAESAVP